MYGCTYVRTWTFHVGTITFEGVSGSKQNLVGVSRDEIFQYTNEYTESPEYTKSIQTTVNQII